MSDRAAFLRTGSASAAPAAQSPGPPRRAARVRRVPGEGGIWVFIIGDMLMFGVFFAAFLVQRAQQPEVFAQGRSTMTIAFGAVNTLVLLTSSLFVVTAVHAHAEGQRGRARWLVSFAGVCAAAFAAIKITEWGIKLHDGHAPGDSLFYTYYYLLTGVHFLHLTIGAIVLTFWWRMLSRPARDDAQAERRVVECCASYWHLVDLLWIVLFPVLYFSST